MSEANRLTTAEVAAKLEAGESLYDDSLQLAWVDLLNRYPFTWFVTFTFKTAVHPENADKCFQLWIKQLNHFLYGKSKARKGLSVYWVRGLEWQKRDVIHYHAIIGDVTPLTERIGFSRSQTEKSSLLYWTELWWRIGGMCRIEEIKSAESVNKYISKYIAKDGEIDVSNNLRDFIPPQSGFGYR